MLQDKLAKVFQPQEYEPYTDPDLMIYGGGFFSDGDKRTMQRIHDTPPEELGNQSWVFDDARLGEMLLRFRARNYPETLSADEQAQWQEHCRQRLNEGDAGHLGFEQFFSEIESARAEQAGNEKGLAILDKVEAYGMELQQYLNRN